MPYVAEIGANDLKRNEFRSTTHRFGAFLFSNPGLTAGLDRRRPHLGGPGMIAETDVAYFQFLAVTFLSAVGGRVSGNVSVAQRDDRLDTEVVDGVAQGLAVKLPAAHQYAGPDDVQI